MSDRIIGEKRNVPSSSAKSGMSPVSIAGLYVYPVKSCRGTEIEESLLLDTGLEHDREWMVVTPDGRFLTQREEPRLALVDVDLDPRRLRLASTGQGSVEVSVESRGPSVDVVVWRDRCRALDEGDVAAGWLSGMLGRAVRLVRFDAAGRRPCDPAWTGGVAAHSRFADGFPLLAISRASLDDLNARLPRPLPLNRFRPNLVLDGLPPYGEDRMGDLVAEGLRLRAVKPCTRCRITTTDQQTAVVDPDEPLRTLKAYRWNARLHGIAFGQNVIVVEGAGTTLRRGLELRAAADFG